MKKSILFILNLTAAILMAQEVPESSFHKFRDYSHELDQAISSEARGGISDALHHYRQALWMFRGVAVPGEKRVGRILSAYFPFIMRHYGPEAMEVYARARAHQVKVLAPYLKKYDQEQDASFDSSADTPEPVRPYLADVEPGLQDHGLGHFHTQLSSMGEVGAWEAARILGEALYEAEKADSDPSITYLQALVKTGQAKEAARLIDTFYGKEKDNWLRASAALQAGEVYLAAGQTDKATKAYTDAIRKLDPSVDFDVNVQPIAQFFRSQGLMEESAQLLKFSDQALTKGWADRAKYRKSPAANDDESDEEAEMDAGQLESHIELMKSLGYGHTAIHARIAQLAEENNVDLTAVEWGLLAKLARDGGLLTKARDTARLAIQKLAPQGARQKMEELVSRSKRLLGIAARRSAAEKSGASADDIAPEEEFHGMVFGEMGNELDVLGDFCELIGDTALAREIRQAAAAHWMHPETELGSIWGDPIVKVWRHRDWFDNASQAVMKAGSEREFVPVVQKWIEEARTSMQADDLTTGEWMLARCLWGSGQKEEARNKMRKLMGISAGTASRWLALLPPEEAAQRLSELEVYRIPFSVGDGQLAAEAVLQFKGAGLEIQMMEQLLEDQAKGTNANLVEELRGLRQRLLNQVLGGAPEASQAAVKARIQALRRQLLGQRDLMQSLVTPEQVEQSLPADGVLLDWVKFPNLATGTDHYAAVIFRRGVAPQLVDCGSANEIEFAVQQFAESVREPESKAKELEEAAARCGKLLLAPLQTYTEGARTVYISPDGWLNFLSFAAMTVNGMLAGEKWEMIYLASARDVLTLNSTPVPASKEAILVGNPDYNASPYSASGRELEGGQVFAKRSLTVSAANFRMSALPGTAAEIAALRQMFEKDGWKTSVYEGASATENQIISSIPRAQVVHLATHGFFMDRLPGASMALGQQSGQNEMPLFRSGLALAGANATAAEWKKGRLVDSNHDGFLLASELGRLNLRGTELLVLSACDTGVGTASAGDGVLGLRRACAQAGARHALLSLWPVNDEATVSLMTNFYTHWLSGKTPAQALAAVQKESLAHYRQKFDLATAINFAAPFVLTVLPDLSRANATQQSAPEASAPLEDAARFDWRGQDRPMDIVYRHLYYSGESAWLQNLGYMYDDTVVYYGKRMTRQEVIQDNAEYLTKHSSQLCVDGDPAVTVDGDTATVSFKMEYWSSSSETGRKSHGVRPMRMLLRRVPGSWKITELNPAGEARMVDTTEAKQLATSVGGNSPEKVLRQFLAASMDDARLNEASNLFAPTAAYFGKSISREMILKDSLEYAAKTPTRSFTLSGNVNATIEGKIATLRYIMLVDCSGVKRTTGTRKMVMKLQHTTEGWKIIHLDNVK